MSIKIKDIPINDRPIERLINKGVEVLSNEELLAILIKTGTKNCSSKDVALSLLSKIGDITNLKNINFEYLKKIKGIGPSKAAIILASLELGKRVNRVDNINGLNLNNSEIVYEYFKKILGDKKQEYFYSVYLDSSNKIINTKELFKGTLNRSLIHPREIFKEAYLLSANSIICIHNHPSGNLNPSNDDILMTDNLVQIGNLLGIKVLDHMIITNNGYYSFHENGDI